MEKIKEFEVFFPKVVFLKLFLRRNTSQFEKFYPAHSQTEKYENQSK